MSTTSNHRRHIDFSLAMKKSENIAKPRIAGILGSTLEIDYVNSIKHLLKWKRHVELEMALRTAFVVDSLFPSEEASGRHFKISVKNIFPMKNMA